MKSKILGLVAVGLLAGPMAATAVPIMDQQNVGSFTGGIELSSPITQTFTVGLSGTLTGLDLQLARSATASSSLNLELRRGATAIATAVISPTVGNPIVPTFGFIFVDLSSLGLLVTSAEVLSIYLSNPSGNDAALCGEWCWAGSLANEYLGGAADGSTLRDMGFRTYVDTAASVPEPGTLALLGLGLLGLGVTRRKAA